MTRRRLWLCLGAVVLVAAVVLVVRFEPTCVLRGLLAGEPFYRGRPTCYWREVLRSDGRTGYVIRKTVEDFREVDAALPVLRQCAHDPDKNVRWPALALLGHHDLRPQAVLDLLVAALDDAEAPVRFTAVVVLVEWGPPAKPAVPALTARLADPEVPVAHFADVALWRVDPTAAAASWHAFRSAEFGFSVQLPGQFEREDKSSMDDVVVAHSFQDWHRDGPYQSPMRYAVLVVEYPEAFIQGTTDEERFEALKESAPFLTGGKVVEDKEMALGNHHGREQVLEVEGMGRTRSRLFWVGPRLYAVGVVYQEKFLNEPAATFFLDSFRLEEKPRKSV